MRIFPTSVLLAVAVLLALVAPANAQITPGGGVQLQNAGSYIGHTNTINCATGCTFSLVGGIGNLIVSGGSSGTVTQVNTTSPIIGGPITTTGTISILDFVASGASHARGAVPDPGATPGTTKFLREDASWQVPPGSVTSIATTSPITGGPITSTGTIACATCVTSASSLTSTAVMTGGGSQASQTPSATTTLDASGNLALAGGLTVTTRTGTPATMAVFTSGGVLAETTLPAAGVTSVTGTANQITSSPTTGAVTLSLPSAVTLPGSLTVTTRTGTPATMAVFTSGGVLAETTLPVSGVTSATGTANQITVSASTGAVTWSLPSAVTMPGSLTVTTRTGTPATMAVFTSGGVLAETTLPTSGVTSIATTSPITGGTITTTGTIACATCVTSAASLTANAIVLGAGSQATSALGSLGTTTTVLHGNAAGAPTFGAVVLTTDVSGVLPVANGGAATAITWTNCFMGATRCDVANTTEIINSLTTRKVWLFELPYAMTVNQFSTIFGSAVTPGTMRMCVYTADGATKSIDITVTPATGVVSGAVSAVALTPGLYYFVVGCATTCNVQLNSGFAMTVLLTTSTPSGKTPWVGTVSHTSGTCNTTLGTVTAAANTTPVFRLDN